VARQQLDEVEQQIEVGLLPEIEAAAARAEVARRKQALIDARSLMEERRLRLVRLIDGQGTGQADRRILAVSDPMIEPRPIRDQEQRVRLALRSRSDLAEAGLRRQQGRLETIATKNGLLPRLDLFLRLGQTGYAESFGASFQSIDGDTSDFSIGLRLNHFLRNRAAEARHQASLASHRQALEAVDNLRQIVRLDVRLAVNEVERTRKQIAASTATRRLEEQALRAEKERFAVGASTALLVAQVQRDLLVSQIAEVRAIINYRLALVQLYLAEGSLLERRGIVLDTR
jgi:outer membrane protein TolC